MDITDYKPSEEQIQDLNKPLEQRIIELDNMNQELETLNYSVSHELRAPLQVIGASCHVLTQYYQDTMSEEITQCITILQRSIKRINQVIEEMLLFSKLRQQQMNYEQHNLDELAQSVFEEIKALYPERKCKLVVHQLPSAYCDQVLITEVFSNLLSNAVKFTKKKPDAEIEIGAQVEDGENIYYVKDNGIGFDMAEAENLFEVFQRFHTSPDFEGTGVGLAIVQHIIKRHGGRVWAEGKLNQGATFHFTLPKSAPTTVNSEKKHVDFCP